MSHAIDRKATLGGLVAILLWSSLALLTTLTGDLPPFLVLAISFGCGGAIGLLHVLRDGESGLRSMRAPLTTSVSDRWCCATRR